MHPLAKVALGAVATAYANHAIVKPVQVARVARAYASRVGKPMLSFVPQPGATLKSIVRPALALGDINLHHEATGRSNGPGRIGRGSPYQIPVPPRTFGAIFSCDTLEHLDRPDIALLEWHRVADRVFVIVPPWWTPEAWLSKWYIDSEIRRAWPVWARQNRTIWLPSTGSRAYDAGTCPTPQPRRSPGRAAQPTTAARPTVSRQQQPPSPPPPTPELVRPGLPSNASEGSASNETALRPQTQSLLQQTVVSIPELPEEDSLFSEEESSDSQDQSSDQPYLPPAGVSPSSTSVSSMMIMSGPDPESD